MPKTAPRRTRRVNNPFDASVEVRMYSTEKAKLFDEAKARGLSASDLIRQQLGNLIDTAPPVPGQSSPQTDEAAQEAPVSLIDALADQVGGAGHAMLKIRLGKVTVNGEPWGHTEIPSDLLPHVAVDGQPLVLAA